MVQGVRIDEASSYEIRVAGTLDPSWSDWFGGLRIEVQAEETRLWGELPDQSALLGILGVIHNLGLVLLSVERVGGMS